MHDTVIPTPALDRTSGSDLPGRDLAESSTPLGAASRGSSSSSSGYGEKPARAVRGGGEAQAEVYRDDKSAISEPRFINAHACAHLFSSSLLSASLLLLCSLSDLVVVTLIKDESGVFLEKDCAATSSELTMPRDGH